MFNKRLISSLVLLLIILLNLFVFPKWVFAFFVVIFCALAAYEFFLLIEKKQLPALKFLGTFIAAAIPFAIFKGFEMTQGWELFFVVLSIFSLFIVQLTRRENDQAIVAISLTLFGIFYVGWLLSFLVRIFLLPAGSALVFFLIVVTKIGDVAAYLGGRRFGKHLLIKRISPKKTVEGALFAFFATLLLSCVSKIYLPQIPFGHLVFLGALLGVVGQIGDLSESLIKRDCQIKDSGILIPGFGGVLDLIDSLLFTAPVFYLYLTYVNFIK